MPDPTYVMAEIRRVPEWEVAHTLSEILNDNAPIGWFKYVGTAKCLLAAYDMRRKEGEASNATG